ncbi:MAG: hypothetical protein M0P69_20585 [Bacteroidales bacterium]|nr:hypothetical protein [Bacteroidales bacterium]
MTTKERLDQIEQDIRDIQRFCEETHEALKSLVEQINESIDAMNKWRRSVARVINTHGWI